MGLAAYGQPEQLEVFRDILRHDHKFTGFHLGLEYFTHHRTGPEMAWAESDKMPALGKLFSEEMSRKLGRARAPEEPLDSVIATWRHHCRHGWRKFIFEC